MKLLRKVDRELKVEEITELFVKVVFGRSPIFMMRVIEQMATRFGDLLGIKELQMSVKKRKSFASIRAYHAHIARRGNFALWSNFGLKRRCA